MCGFAGFHYLEQVPTNPELLLNNMGLAIRTRGPDSSGIWFDAKNGIGLSHRRLAVVDLSNAGHQPMHSQSGQFTMAFNGEIYNHLDIRSELDRSKSYNWNGHSDTETLLRAIESWGLEKTLKKLIGMFSIALWDDKKKSITLARDRFGEKPLYYSMQKDVFMFASELKSFRENPDFVAEIDRNSMTLLLRHNCIPAPYSIYQDTFKVLPGELVEFTAGVIEKRTYWSSKDVIAKSSAGEYIGVAEIETMLKKAVRRQMLSDVPLGAFLSGGIDSSLIVALLQAESEKAVQTFTIGFEDPEHDEAGYARDIASHLGTQHTELYVTPDDLITVVEQLSEIYDEPFSDSSQIPTYLVSKLASNHVTVALSGDGGDELFCGYNRYAFTAKFWPTLQMIPHSVRKFGLAFFGFIPTSVWEIFKNTMSRNPRARNFFKMVAKGIPILDAQDPTEIYRRLVSHNMEPEQFVLFSSEPNTSVSDPRNSISLRTPVQDMMALDTISYLPDDILVKVDRAAMANSLETRIPFLDHELFELAWRLPLADKLHNGRGKVCLREILYKYVPKSLIERPKAGFSVPLASWLRGPLFDWASELLSEQRLMEEGFFDPKKVTQMWREHTSGKKDWHYLLWDILMFQTWFEKHHK